MDEYWPAHTAEYNPVYEYSIYDSQLYRYRSTTARITTCTVYVLHTGTLPVQISVYSYELTQASYRVYSVTGVYTGARGLSQFNDEYFLYISLANEIYKKYSSLNCDRPLAPV